MGTEAGRFGGAGKKKREEVEAVKKNHAKGKKKLWQRGKITFASPSEDLSQEYHFIYCSYYRRSSALSEDLSLTFVPL